LARTCLSKATAPTIINAVRHHRVGMWNVVYLVRILHPQIRLQLSLRHQLLQLFQQSSFDHLHNRSRVSAREHLLRSWAKLVTRHTRLTSGLSGRPKTHARITLIAHVTPPILPSLHAVAGSGLLNAQRQLLIVFRNPASEPTDGGDAVWTAFSSWRIRSPLNPRRNRST
jgi:hypothetical protein